MCENESSEEEYEDESSEEEYEDESSEEEYEDESSEEENQPNYHEEMQDFFNRVEKKFTAIDSTNNKTPTELFEEALKDLKKGK